MAPRRVARNRLVGSGWRWHGLKQLDGLKSETFLAPMRDKGRFKEFMDSLKVTAVIDPLAGLFSAGCRARMLAEPGETLA